MSHFVPKLAMLAAATVFSAELFAATYTTDLLGTVTENQLLDTVSLPIGASDAGVLDLSTQQLSQNIFYENEFFGSLKVKFSGLLNVNFTTGEGVITNFSCPAPGNVDLICPSSIELTSIEMNQDLAALFNDDTNDSGVVEFGFTAIGLYDNGFMKLDQQYEFNVVAASEVPVPAGFWLLGSALAGLAGVKRKG